MAEKAEFLCPLCSSAKHRPFEQVSSFGLKINYFLCSNCGLVFQNPAASQAGDPQFYEQTYRKIYQQSELPTPKDLRQQHLRAEHALRFLQANGVKKLARCLDIGASSGLFLETLRNELGAQVAGVELGQAYREIAAAKDIAMYSSLDELEKSRLRKFQLVSLMHVLEHLNDPLAELIRIREQLLSSDGYLLVEVPNLYAHDSFELAHLLCFSPHTLKQILEKAGFQILRYKAHGQPRSKTLKLFLTVLAKPSASVEASFRVKQEHFVHVKRQTGMLWRKILSKFLPAMTWLPLEDA